MTMFDLDDRRVSIHPACFPPSGLTPRIVRSAEVADPSDAPVTTDQDV
jgi:hypothetical protein